MSRHLRARRHPGRAVGDIFVRRANRFLAGDARYLTNEGRVFFNSDDALVPQDVNGTWDVYEYEPAGVPQGGEHPCGASSTTGGVVFKPAHQYEVEGQKGEEGAGCVGLISSGGSAQESGAPASATFSGIGDLPASPPAVVKRR